MKSQMQQAFEAALIAKAPDYHQPGLELGVLTSATVASLDRALDELSDEVRDELTGKICDFSPHSWLRVVKSEVDEALDAAYKYLKTESTNRTY